MRRVAGFATAALIVAALLPDGGATGAATPSAGYRADDYADGQAMSILPAGENGLVNPLDALSFAVTKKRPANSDDQLAPYANLLYGYPTLTDSGLGQYYDDESFGVRASDIVRTERPTFGVTIYRDRHDVPHVYAANDQALAFGAGYAQAEDRLFFMDVLRHYAEGTLASFLGASCEFEQMDHDQLLVAPYTPAQATAQVDALPTEYGAQGTLAKSMIENYVRGVNAYVTQALLDPRRLPAEYAAVLPGLGPTPWSVADVVAAASLIGGLLGRGGGGEMANAHLLEYLQHRLGTSSGAAAFTQLRTANDPLAPTTADVAFPYEIPGTIDPSTTALPDYGAPITGGPVATTKGCAQTSNQVGAPLARALAAKVPQHMSNALVVDADHSADGHPVAVFGPQVAYWSPEALSLIDLHSPDYAAEGASFPGTGIVELGRGEDFAWSATSAGTDIIDTRLEKICNPLGGAPAANGTYYLFRGKCLPMVNEHFREAVLPKLEGPGQPGVIDHAIHLTRHGVVQGWTTSDGKPVAVVQQRSTYNHDVDAVIGFLGWGQPARTHDVTSWMANANSIPFTFNWFYVDDRDIGYFASGRDPIRPSDVDPDLPTWGTGGSEWLGLLPASAHVHEINPPQGFFVSWNNKPAPQFAAADDQYGYGQVYRSVLLADELEAGFAAHGRLTRAQVVQAMEDAATQDLDGVAVVPQLLAYLAGRPEPAGVQAMLGELSSWVGDGAHRRKAAAGDSQYAHAAAVAIADELIPNLIHALFDGLLGAGGMSANAFDALPMSFVDYPHDHKGSAYDGGYESYLLTVLQQLRGLAPADAFGPAVADHLCTGGLSTCGAAVDGALRSTYAALVAANGSDDVSSWTASTASKAAGQAMPQFDDIRYRMIGLIGQPDQDWQNRPTFQQVVQFPRHRAR